MAHLSLFTTNDMLWFRNVVDVWWSCRWYDATQFPNVLNLLDWTCFKSLLVQLHYCYDASEWVCYGFIVPFLLHLALTSTRTQGMRFWLQDQRSLWPHKTRFWPTIEMLIMITFIQMCDRITLCFDNVKWWRFGQTCRMQLYWLVEAKVILSYGLKYKITLWWSLGVGF